MKRSFIAAAAVAALGLLSMGLLGALVYLLAAPVLWPIYGNFEHWSGDDVWPAMIGAGMLWALGFLAAGWLSRRLAAAAWPKWRRRAVYGLVLWLSAVAIWALLLATMDIRLS